MTKQELRQWIIDNASKILAGYPEAINAIESNIESAIAEHEAKSSTDNFWFDKFNELYPDQVRKILDSLKGGEG